MKNILLIGMPGSGKTSVGLALSKKLDMNFIDVDKFIEEKESKTISKIFLNGEEYFRDIESKYMEIISKSCENTIISSGGGAVLRKKNIDVFKENSIVIFLNRSVTNILTTLKTSGRPLLKNDSAKIYSLYEERQHLYEKYSDFKFDNVFSLDESVKKLYELVLSKYSGRI